VKVLLRNPVRELEFGDPITVRALQACEQSGATTNNDICSFCVLTERATRPVPLTIGRKPEEVAA
jgi:recombinational DNA repair protein RecR